MGMTCTQATARFCDLLDGNLDDIERALVESHLASCEACTASLAALRRGHEMLSAGLPALSDSISPPPFLALKIKHKLSHSSGRSWQVPVRSKLWAAAAAVAVLLAGSIIYHDLLGPVSTSGTPATASRTTQPGRQPAADIAGSPSLAQPGSRPVLFVIIDGSQLIGTPVRELQRRDAMRTAQSVNPSEEEQLIAPRFPSRIPRIQTPVLVRPVSLKQDM